jgi:tetratricopeptide (TPR) repeat protein
LAHRLDAVSTLIRAGRYDEALQGAAAAVELDPSHERARATLGWALFLGGRREEGLAELERAAASAPGSTLWLGQLGQAYAMAGRHERARDVLRELEARAGNGFVSPYHLAYVYTGLGEADRALDCLERRGRADGCGLRDKGFLSVHGLARPRALSGTASTDEAGVARRICPEVSHDALQRDRHLSRSLEL